MITGEELDALIAEDEAYDYSEEILRWQEELSHEAYHTAGPSEELVQWWVWVRQEEVREMLRNMGHNEWDYRLCISDKLHRLMMDV